jgi:hypothetical protein
MEMITLTVSSFPLPPSLPLSLPLLQLLINVELKRVDKPGERGFKG